MQLAKINPGKNTEASLGYFIIFPLLPIPFGWR